MENNEKVDPDFLKGFNEGYTIAQYMPDLAEQLAKVEIDNERTAGFQAGRGQYLVEQTRERLPSWLKGERIAKTDPSPTKDKDRDIEPEK